MKRIVIIGLILAAAIVGYTIYRKLNDRNVYNRYLIDIGIPLATVNQMSLPEIKAAFNYFKKYGRTGKGISIDMPDYNILADIRIKYGIFS